MPYTIYMVTCTPPIVALIKTYKAGLVLSVTRIIRAALTKFRVCVCVRVCVTTPPKPLNRFAKKLYQQIERLTLIDIGLSLIHI